MITYAAAITAAVSVGRIRSNTRARGAIAGAAVCLRRVGAAHERCHALDQIARSSHGQCPASASALDPRSRQPGGVRVGERRRIPGVALAPDRVSAPRRDRSRSPARPGRLDFGGPSCPRLSVSPPRAPPPVLAWPTVPIVLSCADRTRRRIARCVPWSNCSQTASIRAVRPRVRSRRSPAASARVSIRAWSSPSGPRRSPRICHHRTSRGHANPSNSGGALQQHEPLDPLGMALRRASGRRRRPSRGATSFTASTSQLGEEPLDESGQAVERVVEVAALARAAEPDQIGRDPTGTGEELDPVVRARRNPVEVQRRHARAASALR